MDKIGKSLAGIGLFDVVSNRHCPQCGGLMREMDRIDEGTTTYIWFECGRDDCDGQWLQSHTNFITLQVDNTIPRGVLQ